MTRTETRSRGVWGEVRLVPSRFAGSEVVLGHRGCCGCIHEWPRRRRIAIALCVFSSCAGTLRGMNAWNAWNVVRVARRYCRNASLPVSSSTSNGGRSAR